MTWAPRPSATPSATMLGNMGVCQKMGVMFLESTYPQGVTTNIPWNLRSTLTGMVDGTSSTALVSENTLTGVSTPTPYSANLEANWATPMPTFSTFIGASNVCTQTVPVTAGTTLNCTAGLSLLQPANDIDGPGWALANKTGTLENINFGQNLTIEGSFPFSNSAHPGGFNMVFCDGAVRFITAQIDGTVYSKLITPAGSRLPLYAKQLPDVAGCLRQLDHPSRSGRGVGEGVSERIPPGDRAVSTTPGEVPSEGSSTGRFLLAERL